ncbi:RNA 2',3'-cyclic phosphodiesterase [Chromohalobacter canadensis]|uniref:RNA 2',3'-cyclic phosphodiesterase n=1 Tax=Chromohalobacter canadensis TaxID=141389 RepID=A0A285VDR8_9GAMM|nr:RNA 2',3'-cyclic phosphodiesterase [Chromohalobacter canadensis]MCK0769312.1 RNA 2',3'-cyclic phosphodiesterase [Chromohalobacter canadensis]WQH10633.1 RNA 2',3'-cyclic phosphodiesterase [Chromohalobacter canadensis]SOC51216.1 2'-5' RNA ligase [Chromohalobacter canadensis]
MTASRRLFFALWPDDASRRALAAEAERLAPHCGGYPLPAENMHITLAFLGNVDASRLEALVDLTRAWPALQGEWALDRLGHFPKPRIVWAGSQAPSAALLALDTELWQALSHHGFTAPQREFTPHVSLVRQADRAAPESRLSTPLLWRFDHLAMVESQLGDGGSRYRTLACNHDRH